MIYYIIHAAWSFRFCSDDFIIHCTFDTVWIAKIMERHGLKAHDLVASSEEQITHKMVGRAVKGRRLTPGVKRKIFNALVKAAGKSYSPEDLFNY